MKKTQQQVYLEKLAHPICERFKAERTSYELAVSSCIILYHFADVVGFSKGIRSREAVEMITKRVPKFEAISALANAAKHVELTRHPNRAMIGLRSDDMKHEQGAAFSDGSYFSDGSTFADMPVSLVVITPDGQKHDVLSTCLGVRQELEAVDFLEE